MAKDTKNLEQHFELNEVGGWIALHPKAGFELKGFRTARLAKFIAPRLLQFTIGATKLGETRRLNKTIRTIISTEGIEVVEGFTTDGTSKPKKEYPGISLHKLTPSNLDRIVLQVLGAVTQVQSAGGT